MDNLKKLYIYKSLSNDETVLSGIRFCDFIEHSPIPINNILLLKGDCIGEKSWNRFELFEGHEQIAKLKQEDIYSHGDFSFVDYANTGSLHLLTDEQIAELLYFSHMRKPLRSPFFDALRNEFAYLAHDDGWYCKVYCKDKQVPISILLGKLRVVVQKIVGNDLYTLPAGLVESIYELSSKGLLIELESAPHKNKAIAIRLYVVGEYENMDILLNNSKQIRTSISYEEKIVGMPRGRPC